MAGVPPWLKPAPKAVKLKRAVKAKAKPKPMKRTKRR